MAFTYANGMLCAEQVSLEEIARRFGTPCYVYSRAAIERAYLEFTDEFAGRPALVCYSVKANSSLAWNEAKSATRDAWHRVEHALPGDADGDGR